jgi:hypothetical protein
MSQHNFAKYLLLITLGHTSVGLFLFTGPLWTIVEMGWINVIGFDYLLGSSAVWFMLFSYPLWMIVVQFWGQNDKVKISFLIVAIIGGLLGASLMPNSGFWLILILSCVALYQTHTR